MLQYPLLQGDKVSILMEYFKASDTATAIIKVNDRDQIAAMVGTLMSHCIQLDYFTSKEVLLITSKAIGDAQNVQNDDEFSKHKELRIVQ